VTDDAPIPDPATSERVETASETGIDLDAIRRDLEDVEAALARLDAGTYWTDEVTGAALDEDFLRTHPLARQHRDGSEVSS
jgi:RNA polymerase-binding transcription factor DksA